MSVLSFIYVGCGGAVGACLRYALGVVWPSLGATLFVNILGSFLIAIIWYYTTSRSMPAVMLFAATGVLGGFTTFSTFSLQVLQLIEAQKFTGAFAYALISVLGSLSACFIGIRVARGVTFN